MPPTKAQKNASAINKLKEARAGIDKLKESLSGQHNSELTNMAVRHLSCASYALVDRMIELGMVMKLENSDEQ